MSDKNSDKNEKSKLLAVLRRAGIVLLSLLSAFAGAWGGSYFQAKRDIAMRKYDLMTDFHCRTAELFSEAQFLGNPLVQKYGLDRVNRGDVPPEEWAGFNKAIKDLNAQLFKIYVTMPDDGYGRIRGAIPPGVGNIGQFRDQVSNCERPGLAIRNIRSLAT
jgi:hypothetical protein